MRIQRVVRAVILFLAVTGALIASVHYIQRKNYLRPLANLPVPDGSRVYIPDPLVFTPFSPYVLGAQPIAGDDIVKYVNVERKKQGTAPLRVNPLLSKAAKMRADIIFKHQNFSHQDPFEGVELTTVLPRVGYFYRYATENIGMGGSSAEDFVGGFMHSTSHRINLLNPALTESGAAVVDGPYQKWYVYVAVQLFAVPASKEEWLGYSEKDTLYYKQLLDNINGNLKFTQGFLDKKIGNQAYYTGWKHILLRQQAIVEALYSSMKEEVPWREDQLTLIAEYNHNWTIVPKDPST